MSKVYGYCRTALAEGNNMEVQCAVVENYCKTRGMKLERCFCDSGVSAHNMNREGLDELFNVLKKGDVVVIKDISRIARDMMKLEMVIDKMHEIGILKALGTQNSSITSVFGLQIVMIALLTILMSTLGYFFFIDLANDVLIESLKRLAPSRVVLDLDFLTFNFDVALTNMLLISTRS